MENSPEIISTLEHRTHGGLFLIGAVCVVALIVIVVWSGNFGGSGGGGFRTSGDDFGMARFSSEEEFRQYISEAGKEGNYYGDFGFRGGIPELSVGDAFSAPQPSFVGLEGAGVGGGSVSADRVSGTNVQVAGIDEPDIVKTDGENIFYSSPALRQIMSGASVMPEIENGITLEEDLAKEQLVSPGARQRLIMPTPAPDYRRYGSTVVVDAFPPADLDLVSQIDEQGDLLLFDDTLVVLGNNNKITGYDVSDKVNPRQLWQKELSSRQQISTARAYGDTIYLVANTWIHHPRPCPIVYFEQSASPLSIPCTDIYYPRSPTSINSTYTIMSMRPETGEVSDSVSFVGPSGQQVVYMSQDSIYVTYPYSVDVFVLLYRFLDEYASDIFPSSLIARVNKVAGYELSQQTKLQELSIILSEYMQSLDDDELLRVENEITNRASEYLKDNAREFERTSISKIKINNLSISAEGSIPGRLLNQFALDEYDGYLRTAVTVGGRGGGSVLWSLGVGLNFESFNDVYVLDSDLDIVGEVVDLGLTERIYSVRFVRDEGYVVTFRETDPFYVINLSKPRAPEMVGELKIPGFSSYLHPVTEDLVLGVGREGSNVKISLFNVEDPSDPTEESKFKLNEYWSGVLDTHHAFLLDDKHKVFFVPGSRGGYIFSYENNKIKLLKALSNISAQRAIFLDDYMYIIGQDKIVVLNENDWQEVNRLNFQ